MSICARCCRPGRTQCHKDNKCIPLNLRCNNVDDCTDGEDEQHCEPPPPPAAPPISTNSDPVPATDSPVQQSPVTGSVQPDLSTAAPSVPLQYYVDPCSDPNYYAMYYQYCFYGYQQRYQQRLLAALLGSVFSLPLGFDPVNAGLNIACGLPISALTNPTAKPDLDYIIAHQLCHNLVLYNAVVVETADGSAKVSVTTEAEQFLKAARTKIDAAQEAAKTRQEQPLPRKMELYLSVGGDGAQYVLKRLAQRQARNMHDINALKKFADNARDYARALNVDGLLIDWRGDSIEPLIPLIKTLSKSVHIDDPAKNTTRKIDLFLGLTLTDTVLKHSTIDQVKSVVDEVDFVNYISNTHDDTRDFDTLQPQGQFLIDNLFDGVKAKGAKRLPPKISKKFFLPLDVGAKHYILTAEQSKVQFGDSVAGAAFASSNVSQQAGRMSAGEACQALRTLATGPLKYTQQVLKYYAPSGVDDDVTHEPVLYKPKQDLISYETPCTITEKIDWFSKKYKKDQTQLFAGVFVPDITLDDVNGKCTNDGRKYRLLEAIGTKENDRADVLSKCSTNNWT